ncbi:MAG: sigma-70 family RNA polymerase sigma factor [Undibacterium sp.]|nr:sigma-70 family RNA polymerase sigma factor [Opitutaceae bacterium]
MTDDLTLLRRYVEERSEASFTELVGRHVSLVYHAALRQTNDKTLAEDATQTVFTDLAQKAGSLLGRPAISGWLYTSARFAATKAKRTGRRRQNREQEAYKMNEVTHASPTTHDWEQLRPIIDESMHALDERDREAILLRFFEGKPFAEVGAKLSMSEDTARVRVSRALDKLHGLLRKRGISSTSAALGLALGTQAAVAAPVGLAATVAGTALAGATTAAGLTFLGALSTSKLFVAGVGLTACVAIGTALFEARELKKNQTALEVANQETVALRGQLRAMSGQLETANRRIQVQTTPVVGVTTNAGEVPKASETAAEPITSDIVQARYKRGQDLARNGQTAEALAEYLWCLDEGMIRVRSFSGVRASFLLSEIEKLGPSAVPALQERRDRAQKRVFASSSDFDAASDFAALNRTLKEDDFTIAIYDQLPPTDPRRRTLATGAYDQLVSVQRYADAVQARGYAVMLATFESHIKERPLPESAPRSEAFRQVQRTVAINSAAKNIEVLAGAGQLAEARKFAERLLQFDGSPATKAVIQQHATRAGQPGLLGGLNP